MGTLVSYQLENSVATVVMDDLKVNALSPAMLAELNEALDQAEADRAVLVLGGRDGVFSAGFDLKVLRAGGAQARDMVRLGFQTALRLLSFPAPVVIVCTGHAVAMGAFLVASGDYRVGAGGPYAIMANEVALGIPMPRAAIEILRQRLTPAHFTRAIMLAEQYTPGGAVEAGFLDRAVDASDAWNLALTTAASLTALDLEAHRVSKLLARRDTLAALRAAIDADAAQLADAHQASHVHDQ